MRAGDDLVLRLLEALPIGLALFDASDDDFPYLGGNAPFRRLFALTPAPVSGRPAARIFPEARRFEVMRVFRHVRASNEASSLFDPVSGEGVRDARRWQLDVLPLGTGSSGVSHILTAIHETIEREVMRDREREAARQRERADHLEELERAKSQFLNLASHELRGPAATLRGYLSMLQDGTLGPLPSGLRQVLPLLQAKAGQINQLASEMVEASRLEDQVMRLQRERIDLREMLAHLTANAQMAAPHHRLRVDDRTMGPVVTSADRLRIEIVINNLIDNAIKYSPHGGEVRCQLSVSEGSARIAVLDHGIGIAEEDLTRLFVRFSRLTSSQTANIPGTGLGLYLARELARLHGGDIRASSRLGEGSEFTLVLPLGAPTSR